MASVEGKDRNVSIEAEERESSPPSNGSSEARSESSPPASESTDASDTASASANDERARAPDVREVSERAKPKLNEIDDRGESSGAFWFVVVGGAALGGWYLMHSADNPSENRTPLIMPGMVEEQAPRAQKPTVLAAAPAPVAVPTPSANTAGGTSPAGATADDDSETATADLAEPTGYFDRVATLKALSESATRAARCRAAGAPAGSTSVIVSIDPSGKVHSAKIVTAPYVGTPTAKCITSKIEETVLEPFRGKPETISVPVQVY